MKCKCNTEMKILVNDHNGYEDVIGHYHYCDFCGRIYYEDIDPIQPDSSYWKEPIYLTDVLGEILNRGEE